MSTREIADAKKCALTTLDWDTYQVIIRMCKFDKRYHSENKSFSPHITKNSTRRSANA